VCCVGPVHPIYNPYFSAYFLAKTVFFSHNKSVNSVFQPAYQRSQKIPFDYADKPAENTIG
jgi:hypothetical protein